MILVIIAALTGIINLIIYRGIWNNFLSEWLVVNNLVYTAWILLIILDLYENEKKVSISKSFQVYLIAIFFYTSCTILYFPLRNDLRLLKNDIESNIHSPDKQDLFDTTEIKLTLDNVELIHHFFNTFLYFVIAIGFLIEVKEVKEFNLQSYKLGSDGELS